jgi:hypothetical protein
MSVYSSFDDLTRLLVREYFIEVQGDQKVSVHLNITVQKKTCKNI